MCVIAAKYFPNKGWVGVKNRDRTYYPSINIRKSMKDGIERLYIWDENTRYTEGLNEHGLCILNASYSRPNAIKEGKDEESSISAEGEDPNYFSKDGRVIRNALLSKTPEDAVKELIRRRLTGCCLVFNKDTCYVLEADEINGEYRYNSEKVDPKNHIVRTNHGILLPEAGFQRNSSDENLKFKRVSSELRKYITEKLLDHAEHPEDMINHLLYHRGRNKQLNVCRLDFEKGKVRTTGQLMLVPSQNALYYRPIWCHLDYDFNKINKPKQKLWFELLSHRPLIQNMKKYANEA